jgi:multidrug resistance protein, MATE family
VPVFDALSFKEWSVYIKLAVPTTFLNCIEWWAFEIAIIFAGILGKDQLTALVAIMQCNAMIFMISLGMQFAASGLVGGQLGAGNPKQAKKYALLCVLLNLSITCVLAILIPIFSTNIALLFTHEPTTIALIEDTLPYLAIFVIVDGIHGV